MKLYYIFSFMFLSFIFFSFNYSCAQIINTRFNTYFYTWERMDSLKSDGTAISTKHLRGYQNVLFDIAYNKWSFNTSLQTEEDITGKSGRGFAYRLYNVYIKGSNLFNILDIKLGRQYVSAGAGRSSIDGLYFKLKLGENKEYQFLGYTGALTPLTYNFEVYGKVSENFAIGGQFSYYGVKDMIISLSYFNKHSKPRSYYAIRADSLFNPKEIFVNIGEFADQIGGLDFSFVQPGYSFYGKAYFDLNIKKLYRGEIYGIYSFLKNLKLSFGYTYREPQISYNTIFWVFNYRQIQEFEAGVDFTWNRNYNIYARISDVILNDDNSLKLSFGFAHPAYGLSFAKYTGYSGESDGIYGYFNYELIPSKLALTSGLNYSNYKLQNYIDKKEDALCGILGLVYRPINRLSFDLQGQFIKNRVYNNDIRLLFGVGYWLFKKF